MSPTVSSPTIALSGRAMVGAIQESEGRDAAAGVANGGSVMAHSGTLCVGKVGKVGS